MARPKGAISKDPTVSAHANRTRAAKNAAIPGSAEAEALGLATNNSAAKASLMTAQIANLLIAGATFEQIGASIGASADEVEKMLADSSARYVRTQPQLRVFARNMIAADHAKMLAANRDAATDPTHPAKLENQDRMVRILDSLAKLYGANAPVQTEVKVEAAPEAIETMVQTLAAQSGLGYDMAVFDQDVFDAEVVEDAVTQTEQAVLDSAEQIDGEIDAEGQEADE